VKDQDKNISDMKEKRRRRSKYSSKFIPGSAYKQIKEYINNENMDILEANKALQV
jgi:hypothetical protein